MFSLEDKYKNRVFLNWKSIEYKNILFIYGAIVCVIMNLSCINLASVVNELLTKNYYPLIYAAG